MGATSRLSRSDVNVAHKEMPRVSVIIPAYNHALYIRQCVDSVLAQTLADFEVIVVDDGSADATPEIVRGYGGRVTLIQQANRGTQAARNTAIRASSGEYIALLDSDDMWLPHKLERQVAILESRPEVGLVYGFAIRVNSEGSPVAGGACMGKGLSGDEPALHQLLVLNHIPALTAMFRRACIDQVGLFDETLVGAGDHDLWLRIAARWEVACIPEPLALYREHALNTTKALHANKGLGDERWRVLEKTKRWFPITEGTSLIWNRAFASSHLINGETEVYGGDVGAAGAHLAKALELDSTLYDKRDERAMRLGHWVEVLCGGDNTGRRGRAGTEQLFSQVPQTTQVARLKRHVLATFAMTTVFKCYREQDFATVRALLPVAVQAAPEWLLNRGAWSVGIEAFFGPRMAGWLRRGARRILGRGHQSKGTNEAG